MIKITITLRPLQLPGDYEQLAQLLNQVWSEPTTAQRLLEDDQKLYEVGHTWMDENGLLGGYDRERQAAVNEHGEIVGFAWSWRAPWTEPGYLCNTLIVDEAYRNRGIGSLLLRHITQWASKLGAAALLAEVWDDHAEARQFATKRGFAIERHAFQSLLQLDSGECRHAALAPEQPDLRFLTLSDEPGEVSDHKLYALYKESLVDIPGFMGEVPAYEEWLKWYLKVDGFAPERVIIAADGDTFVGVTNVLHNLQTNGMYHEYTGVSRSYRGRKVALALKIKAIELALEHGASYIRTDNDSLNVPILSINRKLGYVPLRGSYRLLAPLETVIASLNQQSPLHKSV
ncbi:GNAT superfamily N-acetyltransferase [Paenibacillus endophyticus]|uniref:GNAT superfamily N-acetyltransferase n=1 Tax=Paenibacillus endophyticus TaxID=1294268 RepID=A0A7W5CE67_9BACL|nr:GNAT family N-acetyltransferase [Paenibacillus endophyticus]MBB3155977.1 GNAT superfamily N-acetyltransferase [Paenibacillus endophyticus]